MDFGRLVFRHGARHVGLIRLIEQGIAAQVRQMAGVLSQHSASDLEGNVVTVVGERIRIRRA
jgi:hypothetical protein